MAEQDSFGKFISFETNLCQDLLSLVIQLCDTSRVLIRSVVIVVVKFA